MYEACVAERGLVGGLLRKKQTPECHVSCKKTGMAATPGRDGPGFVSLRGLRPVLDG